MLKKHSIGLHQGFGHLGEEFTTTNLYYFLAEEYLYFIIIGLAKFSILAFYWRLFRASIRIPCYVLGTITTCWEIAVVGRLLYSEQRCAY